MHLLSADSTLLPPLLLLPAAAADWEHVRQVVNRELVDKLLAMDPHDAWAEWQRICK